MVTTNTALALDEGGSYAIWQPSEEVVPAESRSTVTSAVDLDKQEMLEECKARIVDLLVKDEFIKFQVVRLVLHIERERLFEGALNEGTGEPYRNMTEYFPHLCADLRARFGLMSERTVRELVRVYKVATTGLGLTEQEVLDIGPSHITKVAEALDYDRRTGEIAETPRDGKIGKEEALEILEQVKEGEWRVQDTQAALDEARGVTRRNVILEWDIKSIKDRTVSVRKFEIWEEGPSGWKTFKPQEGLSPEMAHWLSRRMGAASNSEYYLRGGEKDVWE
jgi:hypothetical protein